MTATVPRHTDWRTLRFLGKDGLMHYTYAGSGSKCHTTSTYNTRDNTTAVITCLWCIADRAHKAA